MIGIDICDVTRFDKLGQDDAFIKRIFTDNEIRYCRSSVNSSQRFAARFAAKEAFSKAVGTGIIGDVSLKETEIIRSKSGQPAIVLHGKTREYYDSRFPDKSINLSISHEKTVAVAVVVLL